MQIDVREALAELVKAEMAAYYDGEYMDSGVVKHRLQDFAQAVARAALAASPQAEPDRWQRLYRRAINEANGLTNYVEDRPELRSAERRLDKIEEEARALAAAPKRTE